MLRFCSKEYIPLRVYPMLDLGHDRSPPNQARLWLAKRPESLEIMISRAPASSKETECELIKKKYGLVHVAAEDLLD